jgi:ectoine hydroxylase-related dioxygenase (phytanoyl-CoA dioxygenase family)
MAHSGRYEGICRDNRLPRDAAQQLVTRGFVVLPGPTVSGGISQLQAAYDAAVASADMADVRVSSSTRVTDFVNRSSEFDCIYVYPPLIAACCLLIGRPFKLSNTCGRTLEPGASAQELHADVKCGVDGWPLLGYIWMVDAFDAENGATRFIAGSHHRHYSPIERADGAQNASEEEVLACGPEGSLIVFNASIWHGHSENRSSRRRRSVQGHFVPRDAKGAIDYRARMRAETLGRISDLARYLLDLPATVQDFAGADA